MAKGCKSRILELFNQGLQFREIAKIVRCSTSTVSYHCSKFIINKYSLDKISKYQNYYDKGFTLIETAYNFSLCRRTLAKYIKQRKQKTIVESKLHRVKIHSEYRKRIKQESINYKGGKCQICGYNKCNSALDFHHLNPKEKDYQISGGTKSFDSLKSELDKCVLVCKNCHSEIHEGLINIGL